MERSVVRRPMRVLALVAVLGVIAAGGVGPAGARAPQPPTVELVSAAHLAPDGTVLTVDVIASCSERWSVLESSVTVTQPQASGSGSFPLTCIGFKRVFTASVQSSGGHFELGEAQATATVLVQRGRTERAQDSATVELEPTVAVDLAPTAQLAAGGTSATIDVTVACPRGAQGGGSYVAISQGNVVGNGTYVPTCDGEPHTFTVTVTAREGTFQAGDARALSFANVSFEGQSFSGVADEPVQLVN